MASIDRSDPVILGHVLAEHRDLFNLMRSVREAFAVAGPPTAERRADLHGALRHLRDHLAADAWPRAGQAFETFAENMAAHERRENAVVQEGYNEDLGLVE